MSDYAYEGLHRKAYDGGQEHGELLFIPVCPDCGRFVKADSSVLINGLGELSKEPNATCSKCGRVNMPFEGYI